MRRDTPQLDAFKTSNLNCLRERNSQLLSPLPLPLILSLALSVTSGLFALPLGLRGERKVAVPGGCPSPPPRFVFPLPVVIPRW